MKTKLISLLLLATLILSGCTSLVGQEQILGAASDFPDAQWYMVDKFQGYATKADPTKLPIGANPNGQNTSINDGDKISIRKYGTEVFGQATTTESKIRSLHTFRKRDGSNILMRTWSTYVEYFDQENELWEPIITTSTANQEFGFADYNINTDLVSYVYFGNAVDPAMRWSGAITTTTADVAIGTTVVTTTDNFPFTTTGNIWLCGVKMAYSARTVSTFTLTAPSTVACDAGRTAAQSVSEFSAYPRGNIYLIANNRIFVAGVTSTPQAIYFSKYGDADTWLTTLVSSATADAAGIFNLGEGGGAVTGMIQDEGALYFFKKSITYKATLDDSLYTLLPLKPFDGKSQTTGLTNKSMVFTGANGTFFVTPDKQIMLLTRLESLDYPQITPISDQIKPTVDTLGFDGGDGIFFKNSAYFAVKSAGSGSGEDTVLVWNDKAQTWESPIVGWSVSKFAIYDDGDGEALYYGDANTANVYKITEAERTDNGQAFTASWRSKQFNFNEIAPFSEMKEIINFYVEGYISDNTTLNVELLLDEDGYTQAFKSTIKGEDKNNIFNAYPYNVFGLSPFGYQRFGSADDQDKKKFRVYFNRDFRAYPFYNAQVEFTTETENANFEVTAFGFKVRRYSNPENRKLYKSFQ
jgi:hypothetical protein